MKNRKLEAVVNWPGIYRILVKNKKTGRWNEPPRGACYQVSLLKLDQAGKAPRFKFCRDLAEAKACRMGRYEISTISSPPVSMTFRALVDEWKLAQLPHLELTTQIRYESYLQHFHFLGDYAVEEITPSIIDKWIVHIKTPEYLAGYHRTRLNYNHEYSVLKSILGYYSTRRNRNYRLPFLKDHRSKLKVKERPSIEKDLTVDQFKAFMVALRDDVVGTKYEPIFLLAMMQYLTYSRVQDAAALEVESFDFVRNKINVNKKVQWIRKAGIEDRIVDGSKKNGGKEIEMPALAATLFKEWILKSGVRSGTLFLMDGKIISYRAIEYRYSKALAALKLPFTATHILRHASLTEYYQGCHDLKETAKVAGHGSVRSTERYAKVRDEALVNNQRNMDHKLTALTDL